MKPDSIIRICHDYRKSFRPWAWWIESTENHTITRGGDAWTEEAAYAAAERFLTEVAKATQ